MKVADYQLTNIGPTPRDVKTLRREVLDYHLKLGRPVIFKHRWNLQDVEKGLAQLCPNFDDSYHRSQTSCPFCFGTGIAGGYDDGIIQFVTISDTPVDQLKIDKEGYILFDKHPEITAPWYPDMGDGDLIILADFDFADWKVLSTSDRYELNEVKPTTIRGPFQTNPSFQFFKIQQTAKMDRLPNGHVYYNVPIEFDYSILPTVYPPIGADPDDYADNKTLVSFALRITGEENPPSPNPPVIYSQTLKMQGVTGLLTRTTNSTIAVLPS